MTGFCRDHGSSTWSFWALRTRFALEGEAASEPKVAARRVAKTTPVEVDEAIVRIRKELAIAGMRGRCRRGEERLHNHDTLGRGRAAGWTGTGMIKRTVAVLGSSVPEELAGAFGEAPGAVVPLGHLAVLGDYPDHSYDFTQCGYITPGPGAGTRDTGS